MEYVCHGLGVLYMLGMKICDFQQTAQRQNKRCTSLLFDTNRKSYDLSNNVTISNLVLEEQLYIISATVNPGS